MQLPLQPRRSQVFFRPIAPCRRSDHLPEKLSSAKRASVQFTDKFVVRAGRDGECCSHALSSGHAGHAATFPQVTAPSTDLSGALETGSTPLIITTCAVADRPTQAHRHRRCRIHDGRAGHVTWAATGHSTVSRTSSTSPKHACTSPPRPSSPRCRRAVTAGGHFPTEQAALKTLYLVTRGLDPKGTGRHDGPCRGSQP